jgi:hypothetical protein
MDFNTTIDLIIKDLNEASEIIEDLKKYPGVPALQVELAKSKCRSAGDVIALLKSISIPVTAANEPITDKQPLQPVIETVQPPKPEKMTRTVEEKKTDTVPEGISKPPVEKKSETRSQVKKQVDIPSVADKFSHTSDLYEEQSSTLKIEKDLSDQLKVKQIGSLTEAIGISDKFLFIGEIFDGDKEAYSQAISRLDKVENLQDAMAVIMSYTGGNDETEAVRQLLELVKLKLPANE